MNSVYKSVCKQLITVKICFKHLSKPQSNCKDKHVNTCTAFFEYKAVIKQCNDNTATIQFIQL